MARRRGGRARNPANNPEGLGVGALAEGRLPHGARGTVESIAQRPGPDGGPPQPQQASRQPPQQAPPGADMDLFAPTQRPSEPPTTGLNSGPGSGGMVLADDVDMWLRAATDQFPHPDLYRLLEGREF